MFLRALLLVTLLGGIPTVSGAQDPPEYSVAVQLVQQQRWTAALEQIRDLERRYPGNPKVGNLEGLALLGSGRSKDAVRAFEQVLAVHPGFFPALKNLALLEWGSNKSVAAKYTEKALRFSPNDPILNSYAALSAMERKDAVAAKKHLALAGGAISALPPELELHLAFLLGTSGLYQYAIRLYQDILQRGGDNPVVLYNLGLAQYLSGDYQSTIQTLERLRSGHPSSDDLNLLAQAYEKNKQTQLAIDRLREATSLYPGDETNYLDLAAICIDHNAYPLGIEVVQVGLANNPDSERLQLELGLLHALSGRFDVARSEFEKAAKLAPAADLPIAASDLAAIQQNRLQDAIQDLRRKVKDKPDSGILWYLFGKTIMLNGAQPGTPEAAEALTAFRNATRFSPRLPYPYIEMGKIDAESGKTRDAIPLFKKAVMLAPNEPSSYYHLAMAYRRLNLIDQANQMLAKVQELNRHSREFQKAGLASR